MNETGIESKINLIKLYAELSNLTRDICAACEPPFHCCQPVGCDRARYWAKNAWGVKLEERKEGLLFLTSSGCTVTPHMRPVCSMYVCAGKELPPRYFELRAEIAQAEWDKWRTASS